MKTPEYKEKLKKEDALVAANKVMVEFDKKYGGLDKLWDENKLGYEFFNGEEYNRYIEEMYGVSMAVYGDGPMNLSYRTRNDKMMELIRKALDENPGRRVVVLTGAEHKHYFDRALRSMPGVALVKLADILPLKPAPLGENVAGFLKTNLARGYFDDSTPDGLDQIYSGALVSAPSRDGNGRVSRAYTLSEPGPGPADHGRMGKPQSPFNLSSIRPGLGGVPGLGLPECHRSAGGYPRPAGSDPRGFAEFRKDHRSTAISASATISLESATKRSNAIKRAKRSAASSAIRMAISNISFAISRTSLTGEK